MAIKLKSKQEIEIMTRAGQILRETVDELKKLIEPGRTTNEIESAARSEIKKRGGEGSFNQVPGYQWFTCQSVNEQIVHTPPSDQVLRDGDILTIDIGVYLEGFNVDHANTYFVGEKRDPATEKFLRIGSETLKHTLALAGPGRHIGELSKSMQSGIEGAGYHIIKQLTGHGVGKSLHEDPLIPCYIDGPVEKTMKMPVGLTVAIEVMYGMTSGQMKHERGNDWSLVTADGSLSAQFEHTVAITEDGAQILT